MPPCLSSVACPLSVKGQGMPPCLSRVSCPGWSRVSCGLVWHISAIICLSHETCWRAYFLLRPTPRLCLRQCITMLTPIPIQEPPDNVMQHASLVCSAPVHTSMDHSSCRAQLILQLYMLACLNHCWKPCTALWGTSMVHTNLVDPASSHMLVSKVKPCMSQYKWFTLKLRMAH